MTRKQARAAVLLAWEIPAWTALKMSDRSWNVCTETSAEYDALMNEAADQIINAAMEGAKS